jgi:hypothetical protein
METLGGDDIVGYPLKSRRLKKRLIATTLPGSGSTN